MYVVEISRPPLQVETAAEEPASMVELVVERAALGLRLAASAAVVQSEFA